MKPSERPALRKYMKGRASKQFREVAQRGHLLLRAVLFSSIVNEIGWDMLGPPTFRFLRGNARALAVIEKTSPAASRSRH